VRAKNQDALFDEQRRIDNMPPPLPPQDLQHFHDQEIQPEVVEEDPDMPEGGAAAVA